MEYNLGLGSLCLAKLQDVHSRKIIKDHLRIIELALTVIFPYDIQNNKTATVPAESLEFPIA